MTSSDDSFAARESLSLQDLAHAAPAAFADHTAKSTDSKYVFISTREIVSALMNPGFAPTHTMQRAFIGLLASLMRRTPCRPALLAHGGPDMLACSRFHRTKEGP